MTSLAFQDAARVIAAARSVVAIGHINPDGDALGSALAIAITCRAAGKDAYVTFGEPLALPDQFRYLDLDAVTPAADIPSGVDVVVACDTADRERLGSAAKIADAATVLVVIDHHASNGGFGDIELVDPTAAATAQLVYVLLAEELGWELNAAAATALYTGLVTDTGRFQYSATTPAVHAIAGALLAAGADPDEVATHIYGEAPFGYLAVAGAAMTRAKLEAPERLVWTVVYESDLRNADVGYEDTDGLIDLLRIAQEAEVACLFKQTSSGEFKASLRSRGAVDVNAIAGTFGGGGHHNAAGFTAQQSVESIVAGIKDLLA